MARRLLDEDRLDLAAGAVQRALHAGLFPSDAFDLQRMIEAEFGARQRGARLRIAERLLIEARPEDWLGHWADILQTAERAQQDVGEALGAKWGAPVLLTLIPVDEWMEFVHGRYGYYSQRTEAHKICLPPASVRDLTTFRRAARHEFAHAALRDVARHVPRWLDEGLAVVLEGGSTADETRRYRIHRGRGRRLTLEGLEGSFTSYHLDLGSLDAAICYAGAGAFAARMLRIGGWYAVRAFLHGLRAGDRVDKAYRRSFGESLREAERRWQDEED